MREKDIAKPIVSYLEAAGWDVYQEVKFKYNSEVADIACVKQNKLWIIEVKTSLTLTVMEQAYNWRCHYRSCAVPSTRKRRSNFVYMLAREHLEIGILEIGAAGRIFEKVKPPYMDKYNTFSNRLMPQLRPEHKEYALAGSSKGGYFTPYKETMGKVQEYIINNPRCSLNEIINNVGKGHYKTKNSAKQSIRMALAEWESDWCNTTIYSGQKVYYAKKNTLSV